MNTASKMLEKPMTRKHLAFLTSSVYFRACAACASGAALIWRCCSVGEAGAPMRGLERYAYGEREGLGEAGCDGGGDGDGDVDGGVCTIALLCGTNPVAPAEGKAKAVGWSRWCW